MISAIIIVTCFIFVFCLYVIFGGYERIVGRVSKEDISDFAEVLKDFGLGIFVNATYSAFNDSNGVNINISLTATFSLAIILVALKIKRWFR